MPDMNLHVELFCSECGEDLGRLLGARVGRHPNGLKVTAPPCPKCLKAAQYEGYDNGYDNGYVDGVEWG